MTANINNASTATTTKYSTRNPSVVGKNDNRHATQNKDHASTCRYVANGTYVCELTPCRCANCTACSTRDDTSSASSSRSIGERDGKGREDYHDFGTALYTPPYSNHHPVTYVKEETGVYTVGRRGGRHKRTQVYVGPPHISLPHVVPQGVYTTDTGYHGNHVVHAGRIIKARDPYLFRYICHSEPARNITLSRVLNATNLPVGGSSWRLITSSSAQQFNHLIVNRKLLPLNIGFALVYKDEFNGSSDHGVQFMHESNEIDGSKSLTATPINRNPFTTTARAGGVVGQSMRFSVHWNLVSIPSNGMVELYAFEL